MSNDAPQPIIKKIKKVQAAGHHGGAWKVAYADFVTAMMAFFLLMWLLNATSDEQKRGLSNYFGPTGNLTGAGGSGGVLAGLTLKSEGILEDNVSRGDGTQDGQHHGKKAFNQTSEDDPEIDAVESPKPTIPTLDDAMASDASGTASLTEAAKLSEAEKEAAEDATKEAEKIEAENFKEVEEALKQAVQEDPAIKDLAENLIIDQTPEGLRIQIVDKEKYSMFMVGKAAPLAHAIKLFEVVAKIVKNLPNKVSITGHTDSRPYSNKKDYSNWELSTDRANSARRYMLKFGLNQKRMIFVTGKADTEHIIQDNPLSEQNRRISMILHRTATQIIPPSLGEAKVTKKK